MTGFLAGLVTRVLAPPDRAAVRPRPRARFEPAVPGLAWPAGPAAGDAPPAPEGPAAAHQPPADGTVAPDRAATPPGARPRTGHASPRAHPMPPPAAVTDDDGAAGRRPERRAARRRSRPAADPPDPPRADDAGRARPPRAAPPMQPRAEPDLVRPRVAASPGTAAGERIAPPARRPSPTIGAPLPSARAEMNAEPGAGAAARPPRSDGGPSRAAPPPDVHITIGRVEVRADPPRERRSPPVPPPAPSARTRTPPLGLDEYLRRRGTERR